MCETVSFGKPPYKAALLLVGDHMSNLLSNQIIENIEYIANFADDFFGGNPTIKQIILGDDISPLLKFLERYCQCRWMKNLSSGDLLDAIHEFHASNHVV